MSKIQGLASALGVAMLAAGMAAGTVRAQVPDDIYEGLKKIGQIVDPACTAKLYRPLMPANDFNTYWPVGAPAPVMTGPLYAGITIARDVSWGPHPKDLVDIFTADRGGDNRPVIIYVPGGGGNKIEQQAREANVFYDNIGRWATKNGMVGVTVQRHPGGGNWDDTGRDLSVMVDWLKENVAKYRGNPSRMFIWAHSAGNGPLGMYIGHTERWAHGVGVVGAIFMSGNPVGGLVPAGGGRGAAPAGGAPPAGGGSSCNGAGPGGSDGAVSGPSGMMPAAAGAGGGGGRGQAGPVGAPAGGPPAGGPGAGRGGRGGQPLTPAEQAERDNLPGFKASMVKIMLARAELDPGVSGAMTDADIALHDELCKIDGPAAKDGVGHCPTMFYIKRHSHMSEVFSLDTKDETVGKFVLDWMKKVK